MDQSIISKTVNMLLFLATELTLLFLVISYLVGLLQEKIPPAKIKQILSSKNGRGYVIAALLGVITPFCSCSTIPFLKGLLRAKAGFGTMLVFLFSSPLLSPLIIGLFVVTFGIKVAAFYFITAISVAVITGVALEYLGFEKYVKADAYIEPEGQCCNSGCGGNLPTSIWKKVWISTWKDFKKVLPYLLFGVAVGAFVYGFIPTEFISSVASEQNPWAIPVSAVIGIPLYIRAEAVIPLSAALVAKGMSMGAVMALIIGSAGASLTEVILLKAIFKTPMIIAFLTVILTMAVTAGFTYQWIF